jgi:hypothetical protein
MVQDIIHLVVGVMLLALVLVLSFLKGAGGDEDLH